MFDSNVLGFDSETHRWLTKSFERLRDVPFLKDELSAADDGCLRNAVRKLLLSQIHSAATLSHIGASSYFHDNGFLKLVIAEPASEIAEVRIHVWGYPIVSGYTLPVAGGNVHSHSSDFVSLVICGGLTEEIYSERDAWSANERDVIRMVKFVCGSRGLDEKYEMTEACEAVVHRESVAETIASQFQGLRHDLLHRVAPSSIPTVTICFQSRRRSTSTVVYSDLDRRWPQLVSSPSLCVDEVEAAYGWLLNGGVL